MAKKKIPAEAVSVVDLLDLLTPPGQEGKFEQEICISNEPLPAIMSDDEPQLPVSTQDQSVTIQPAEQTKNDSIELIIQDTQTCTACELHATRNKVVPGEGPMTSRLVFIGEAPGADEDATGIPFVGRAGKHFDKILKAAGFARSELYICNILKCRPPGNRTPVLAEMKACTPLLRRQLKLIQPDLIACLGNTAIRYVIGPKTPGITRIHGEWFESIFGIPCMAMYHPSYLIRQNSRAKGSPNWQMWQDIQALKKRYDEL